MRKGRGDGDRSKPDDGLSSGGDQGGAGGNDTDPLSVLMPTQLDRQRQRDTETGRV